MFYLAISLSVDGREARHAALADRLIQHIQEERMGGETLASATSVGMVTAQKKGEREITCLAFLEFQTAARCQRWDF